MSPEFNLPQPTKAPLRVGFLLLPEFSLFAFSCACEPLRVVNRLNRTRLYDHVLISEDGGPVEASNGKALVVDHGIGSDLPRLDIVIVVAGFNPDLYASNSLLSWLRRTSTFGTLLGSIDTGSEVLAQAGLLDGYKATVHWENRQSMAERFPSVTVVPEIFLADRDRLTSAGGTASLDMMLNLIWARNGYSLATATAEQFIYGSIRNSESGQRMTLRRRLMTNNEALLQAVTLMEGSKEEPLTIPEVARSVGTTDRELERLFAHHLKMSPIQYYRKIRLEQARHLLRQTHLPILEVGIACGFSSAAHFSRAYRDTYACTPSDDRKRQREPASSAFFQA